MNSKQPSVILNFIMNAILSMSSFLFPLITFPYVSRILGADGYGKIQLATAFISYFTLFSQLGLPTYGIKACASLKNDRPALSKTVYELWSINIIATIISYAAFFVMLACIPRLRDEKTLYIISSAAVLLNTLSVEWLFKAMEQYSYITIRSLICKAISVIAMFLLVHQKEDYIIYAAISVFAAAGSSFMNLSRLSRYVDLRPVQKLDIKQHLKPVFILFVYTCATTIYVNLDSVMLGFMTTDVQVGLYGAAVKLKNILVSVVTALGAVLLPRVSFYYSQNDMTSFWKTISKSMHFVLLLAAPLTVYCMIMAEPAIIFLAGDGYQGAVSPMIWIMPTLLFIGMTYVMGVEALIPMGKESLVLMASAIAAVVDVVVNALLIPSMKATGAAIGTLIAEILVFVIQYVILRKQAGFIFKSIKFSKLILAVGIAAVSAFGIAFLPLSAFWMLVLSALVFFGVYVLVLIFTRDTLIMDLLGKVTAYLKKRLKTNK